MTSDFSTKITKVKTALEAVFIKKADIKDNLTSTDTDKPLSANQGKQLNDTITTHNSSMYSHQDIRTLLNQKESTTNKVSSITSSNTGSTTQYPNVKAIEDYAEPKKSPLAISQLSSLISSASNNGTIVLDNDYVNGTSNQNIYITDKNITIIGNGHTIDSNNKLVSFTLSNATVTIYDCNFINNTSTSSVNSLFKVATATGSGTLSLNNCTFKNSSIKYYLMNIEGGTLNIRDCFFYNNAQTGSRYILYITNSNLDIQNTTFEKNTLKPVSITNTNATSRSQTITECIFNNNVSAITESSSSGSYKQVVLKNNYFVQAGDTISGCTNNNYLTQHQDISGKANSVHNHSTSDITDFPSIPTNLEDLTLGTGAVQTDTDLDVVSYDDTTDTLYWGRGALSLDLGPDEVYYNSYEIATLNDIPIVTGKENSANKVSSWSATTNNTRYPSEKLVKDSLDAKLELTDLLELIYPIGSIYMEKDTESHSVCPIQTRLGGTWTRIENRFLYASENGQGLGTTGGSANAVVVEHNHTQNAHNHKPNNTSYGFFTGDENIAMTSKRALVSGSGNYSYLYGSAQGTVTEPNTTADTTATNIKTGVDGTGKNMPPYIIVNVWERTA